MSPDEACRILREFCAAAPVIPVLTVADAATARPLAEALVAGGLPVLEVTLRTPAALEVIREMSGVSGCVVGAGTLLSSSDAEDAKDAGARFGVSPGWTEALGDACEAIGLPLLAGAATASEVMALLERGYDMAKFFPAEAMGGIPTLRSFLGPLPRMTFCPTGGVSPSNLDAYLRLDNVICVGGSWVAPVDLIRQGAWSRIEDLARSAASRSA